MVRIGLGALVGLGLLSACSGLATTHEWREEVALHDGGMIVGKWRARVDPGPFGDLVGPERLTFNHPATGQPVVWEDPGKSGSRLMPILLARDDQRLFLVGVPPSGTDYDGFGCPTPPYVVLRYDGGTWMRVPLSELPSRFSNANLLGYEGRDLIRESKGYLTAAQIATYYEGARRDLIVFPYATIDRRIRNPLSLDCSRGALERIYGDGKYDEWKSTGNWLDKTDEEARRLLHGTSGGTKP